MQININTICKIIPTNDHLCFGSIIFLASLLCVFHFPICPDLPTFVRKHTLTAQIEHWRWDFVKAVLNFRVP